jgi:hypothetical protein
MIPVTDSNHKLGIVFSGIWSGWILDNERPSKAIRVLDNIMGVVPVAPGLLRLSGVSDFIRISGFIRHAP